MITDSVAQLVEQYTFNVWVLGSNPSGITKLTLMELIYICEVAQLEEHPDFYREGPGFESQRDHKTNSEGVSNKSFGAGIASRKGAGSP